MQTFPQVVMLYKWDMESNAVENMNACKGHERSVDCLAVDANVSCSFS